MPGIMKRHMILQRYQSMDEELYCQPKEEIIMRSFIEKQHKEQPVRPKKKVKKRKRCKDIRSFFQKRQRSKDNSENIPYGDITVTYH